MKTTNFRLNLDKTFKDKQASIEAKRLLSKGKKINKSLYNQQETSIYLSVSFNCKYYKINTGLKIKPENFDTKAQIVKTRDTKSIQLQLLLNQIKDNCMTDYRELILKKTPINTDVINEILKKSIDPFFSEAKELTFFEAYTQFFDWKAKTVGHKIKKLREEKQMTQQTLSSLCDIDIRTIQRIEKGEYNMSLNILFSISEALEIQSSELISSCSPV